MSDNDQRIRLSLDIDHQTESLLKELCSHQGRKLSKTEVIRRSLGALKFLRSHFGDLNPTSREAIRAAINLTL